MLRVCRHFGGTCRVHLLGQRRNLIACHLFPCWFLARLVLRYQRCRQRSSETSINFQRTTQRYILEILFITTRCTRKILQCSSMGRLLIETLIGICFHACFLPGIFFDHEIGSDMFIWNVGWLPTDYMNFPSHTTELSPQNGSDWKEPCWWGQSIGCITFSPKKPTMFKQTPVGQKADGNRLHIKWKIKYNCQY
jgi:hypothetical protein